MAPAVATGISKHYPSCYAQTTPCAVLAWYVAAFAHALLRLQHPALEGPPLHLQLVLMQAADMSPDETSVVDRPQAPSSAWGLWHRCERKKRLATAQLRLHEITLGCLTTGMTAGHLIEALVAACSMESASSSNSQELRAPSFAQHDWSCLIQEAETQQGGEPSCSALQQDVPPASMEVSSFSSVQPCRSG